MDWNKGYSALYEVMTVDPVSWADTGSLRITGGHISRSGAGLIESGELEMTEDPGECLIRIYLKARQGNDGAREAIFTGLTSSPQRKLDGNRESFPVEIYSVLKMVDDVLVKRGYYAPAGADGAKLAADLLRIGPAPVRIEGESPMLMDPIIAEDSDTYLTMAQEILTAIGWRIRISGDGSITICPETNEISAVFDTYENDSVEMKITDEKDWYGIPNCYRVISGDVCAEAKDDGTGELSIGSRKANRGGTGEIWEFENAATIGSHESISEYTIRRLKEAQKPARRITYIRRFRPNITAGDMVRLNFPRQKINGDFRVKTQKIMLGHAARTEEEVIG